MHADICGPDDIAAITRLRKVLLSLGAELSDRESSSLGVDMYRLTIGPEEITIFADAWSIDIEGPEVLVSRIVDKL